LRRPPTCSSSKLVVDLLLEKDCRFAEEVRHDLGELPVDEVPHAIMVRQEVLSTAERLLASHVLVVQKPLPFKEKQRKKERKKDVSASGGRERERREKSEPLVSGHA